MSSTTQQVWTLMISYGENIRKNSTDADGEEKMVTISGKETPIGLHAWNALKPVLKSMGNVTPFTWNEDGILKIMRENEFREDEKENTYNVFGERENTGCNHFLVQHMRIVHKNPDASYARLMQIAYNVGQLLSCPEELESASPMYNDLLMDQVETYISDETLQKLNEDEESINSLKEAISEVYSLIGISTKGGSRDPYYDKYLKYRSKYASLKEHLQDMQ